jgi:transcription elongation factor Elf1
MENEDTYKYQYNHEIICPHCDYEYSDSWELLDYCIDDYLIEKCKNCGYSFRVIGEITVEYSTDKNIKDV